MLDALRGGQRWITSLIIGVIGLVFVLYLGLRSPLTRSHSGPGGAVVSVGPYHFGFREFERTRARREAAIQEQLGDQYDAKALADTLDQIAAREMVDRALLALAAQDLGLSVSKQEIERLVLDDPGFRGENGRFDVESFRRWTSYEYGSQTAFIEERRLALLSYKMLELLHSQPQVSMGEARDAVQRELEEVQIAFVSVGGGDAAQEKPDEAAVKRALEERAADLRALYEERSGVYNVPEKIRARHILFAVPAGADEAKKEAVRAEAEAALKALREGADFAQLAAQRSDDPGSKAKGGDLGFFARGQMAPAFEAAAFALQEPGQLSDVVRTDYGFHVIRLEERQAPVNRSYDEVSEELARDLLSREAVKARAREKADALAAAVRGGKSLEDAAREAGLSVERSGWLRRRPDGYVPGLGPAQDLLAVAFATQAGTSLPRVFEVGDRLALLQVLGRKPANPEEVESRVAAKRDQLLQQKREERSTAWLDERRQQLIASGELKVDLSSLGRHPNPR
jgi:peptidyl-prolyl cis-trans isomerase D